MPLFGSKHKHDGDTIDETGIGRQHPESERVPGNTTLDTGTQGTQGTNVYDNSGGNRGPYQPYHGAGTLGPVPAAGTNLGPHPDTSGMYHDNNNLNHPTTVPTGTKLTGKFESALGSLVGSSTLEAKGREKEREATIANLAKFQALELAEAERLEREAMLHRQKAAAVGLQGAHPPNSGPDYGAGQWIAPTHPTTGGYPQ